MDDSNSRLRGSAHESIWKRARQRRRSPTYKACGGWTVPVSSEVPFVGTVESWQRVRQKGIQPSQASGQFKPSVRSHAEHSRTERRAKGCSASAIGTRETVCECCRHTEVERLHTTSEQSAEFKRLQRENTDLKRAHARSSIWSSPLFAADLGPPQIIVVRFVDEHVGGPHDDLCAGKSSRSASSCDTGITNVHADNQISMMPAKPVAN